MTETVWIRIKIQRLSRVAHCVNVRTGRLVCGGQVAFNGLTPEQLQACEDLDAGTPRCPECRRIVGQAA